MSKLFFENLHKSLDEFKEAGIYKPEHILETPQGAEVAVKGMGKMINFCSNNYLGLANHPRVLAAAAKGLKEYGYGAASVRFICGTMRVHKELEKRIAQYIGTQDALVMTSCFDANAGIFECLFGPDDALFSDELNHASIIDGLRITKFPKYVYKHADMADLEEKLKAAPQARARLIVTDGVFSMNGDYAPLKEICALAKKYDAMVMVDDSHATGFVGPKGKGTPAEMGVAGDVDIITSTFSKTLAGGNGGFIAAKKVVIDMLRQKLRPYTFSSSLLPLAAAVGIEVINVAEEEGEALRKKLWDNVEYFRAGVTKLGFDVKPSRHPIVAIMLYEAQKAKRFSEELLKNKIFAVGFFYPVVPQGQARVRIQLSALHTKEHLDTALNVFEKLK